MVFVRKTLDVLASYGLACVLLTLLLLLTFFGTLDQVENGLFAAQQKYFESFYLVHWLFGYIPVPLPGVYLVSVVLFVNMLLGAIWRAPKAWKRPGMLIAHGGILFLLFAGFVTYEFSTSGYMTLYEGESSETYSNLFGYEIAITELDAEGNAVDQFVIPEHDFRNLPHQEAKQFGDPDLPFTLVVEGFLPNAEPRPSPPGMAVGVDGVVLEEKERDPMAERNAPGAYATVLPKRNPLPESGVLWLFNAAPWVVEVDGTRYAVALQNQRYEVPFQITLNTFTRELHPRTGLASNFESDVTKIESGIATQVNIRMNEPLRHEGYTFFQASWGPQDAPPGTPLFSQFSVVNNPADQWPLYATFVIAAGLLIHFVQRLFGYFKAEQRRHARA